MSGLNSNMNHSVHRLSSRVNAPPGGFSSLSLGHSYADVAPPSSKAKATFRAHPMPAFVPASMSKNGAFVIPGLENHYYTAAPHTSSRRYPADDLEREEEEDGDKRAYSYRQPQTSSRAGMVPLAQQIARPAPTTLTTYNATRALTAIEYAGELRRQIMEKKQRDCLAAVERTGNERRGLLTKEDVLQARLEAHVRKSTNLPGPASSRRSSGVYAPTNGTGGWSISGN